MPKPLLGEVRSEDTNVVMPLPHRNEVVSTKVRFVRCSMPHPDAAEATVNDHFRVELIGRVDSVAMKEDREGHLTRLVTVELLDADLKPLPRLTGRE